MDTILQIITENRGLIFLHLGVALLILTVYSFAADRFSFSRGRVLVLGALYALDRPCRVAWALSLSRMLTVCYLAVFPGKTDIAFGLVLALLTLGIFFLSHDLKGLINQLMIYAAVYSGLILQGMFFSYYREIESVMAMKLMAIYLGIFAALFSVYQTFRGHERLIMISAGENQEELEKVTRRENEADRILKNRFTAKKEEKKKRGEGKA